jgi:hypothetical protein
MFVIGVAFWSLEMPTPFCSKEIDGGGVAVGPLGGQTADAVRPPAPPASSLRSFGSIHDARSFKRPRIEGLVRLY